MHKQDTATLNQHALAERLRELQLKQWWVARQISVTPLTVNRWLTGKVKRISRDNLVRLSQVLKCDETMLVFSDEADVLATQVEQTEAAHLLTSRESQELFIASKKHDVYEQLLKAVMHPNMKAQQLAEIYARLSTAAAIQGKLDQLRHYARAGLDYAIRAGDSEFEFLIRTNLAACEGQSGNLGKSISGLRDLAAAAESIGNTRARIVALMNLLYALRLAGRLREAVRCAREVIAFCNQNNEPRLQGNALSNCSLIALDMGKYELAARLRLEAERRGGAVADTSRDALAVTFTQYCSSLSGEAVDLAELREKLPALCAKPLADGFGTWAVAVLRRGGALGEAAALLEYFACRQERYAYDEPFVLEERARLALALGRRKEALALREEANRLLRSLGMGGRICDDPGAEAGQQIEGREKLRLPEPWKDPASIW
ncbi:helix-turn-helix domain-containing protein [bacterium]|nr:helix-turn-helix domain-containing protein [bacterium]